MLDPFIRNLSATLCAFAAMTGCTIIPEQRILYTTRENKQSASVLEEECAKIHIPKPPTRPKITRGEVENLPPNALDRAIQSFIAKQDDHISRLERIIYAARVQVRKCQSGEL